MIFQAGPRDIPALALLSRLGVGITSEVRVAVEPVHQRFVGRHDELEAHRVAPLVRVVRQREAPVRRPEDPFRRVPRHAEDLVRLECRRGVGPLDRGRESSKLQRSIEQRISV